MTNAIMLDKRQASSFTWTIKHFSCIVRDKFYYKAFTVDGNKWQIVIKRGYKDESLSVNFGVADSSTLPHGWHVYAAVDLAVIDQVQNKFIIRKERQQYFDKSYKELGYGSFMVVNELSDPGKGYIINDTCVIEANVRVDETKEEQSDASGSPILASQKSPPTGPLNLKTKADEGSLGSSIPDQEGGAADLSSAIEIDDEIKDLFMDMDDLVDSGDVKPATSDQAREKLKSLLALDLGDVAERRGEIIGWASILAPTSPVMKMLLRDLVSSTVFESFLSKKSEAAELEQKLSKHRVLAQAFLEMPKALESLKTEKQLADGSVSTHERIIKECGDEIENLHKKIAQHREQLLEARRLAKEKKETFQAERDRAAKLKEELVATKDIATSWKEAYAAALSKVEELKRSWSIFVQKITL